MLVTMQNIDKFHYSSSVQSFVHLIRNEIVVFLSEMLPKQVPARWREYNFVKLALIFGAIFMFGCLFGYAIFPPVFTKLIGNVSKYLKLFIF